MFKFWTAVEKYKVGDAFQKNFLAEALVAAEDFRLQQMNRWSAVTQYLSKFHEQEYSQLLMQFEIGLAEISSDPPIAPVQQDDGDDNDLLAGELQYRKDRRHEPLVVRSDFPLLDEMTKDAVNEKNFWLWTAALVYWFSDVLIERKRDIDRSNTFFFDPRLLSAIIDIRIPDVRRIQYFNQVSDQVRQSTYLLEEKMQRQSQELDAVINKAREVALFASATNLWLRKARAHTSSYILGFLTIAIAIVSLGWAVFHFGARIWSELPKQSEFTYLATLIVAFGFVAVAWVFRMLGRFVIENFFLAADARQRHTILQTFLTLVGTPDAQMKDGERVLILSALFRAAPGQSSDDPAPASLMDMMKDAVTKPGGK